MAGGLNSFIQAFSRITSALSEWHTDPVGAGIVLVLVLMASGYFYGAVFQKYVKSLKDADCTILGVFFIIACFQIEIFWSVSFDISTDVAFNFLKILLISSPVLCLITRSRPIPSWKHLFSFLTGFLVIVILIDASSRMTTNNIYFDSITYLSQTIESSTASVFGHMVYASGTFLNGIDVLHDLNGYYYFWGMMLRYVSESSMFSISGSLTPVYIWGATALYGMSLGSLILNSINILWKKWKWAGFLLTLLIISPYYTNYWDTTLAFFGNTIRTVACGYSALYIYLLMRKKDPYAAIPLMVTYYASICFSSTGFFLSVFLAGGLFFCLCVSKETNLKTWECYLFSFFPLIHYGLEIFLFSKLNYYLILILSAALTAVLIFIARLIRNHLDILDRIGTSLLPCTFVILCVLSFMNRGGTYGYSYYFYQSSQSDMTLDMTSSSDSASMVRNLIFYGLFFLTALNFRKEKKYRYFLLILGLLFLNPLVEPAIAKYATSQVYSRTFDLLVNPFVFAFMIRNAAMLMKGASWPVLAAAGIFSMMLAYRSLSMIDSNLLNASLIDNYNWEEKADADSWDLYTYIQNNLADDENHPTILSQEIGVKGYVHGVTMSFTSTDFRTVLADPYHDELSKTMVTLLYPMNKFGNESFDYGDVDITKLSELLTAYDPDYLVISNTMAIWDSRGWYNKAYSSVVNSGQCTKIYENDSWAVLQINHEWSEPNKSSERYWVHKLTVPESSETGRNN